MAGEVSVGFYVPTHSTFVLVYPRDSSSIPTKYYAIHITMEKISFLRRILIFLKIFPMVIYILLEIKTYGLGSRGTERQVKVPKYAHVIVFFGF